MILTAALVISIANGGHAFAVASDLKRSLLVTSPVAAGCTPDGRRCPPSTSVVFSDVPEVKYPALIVLPDSSTASAGAVMLLVYRGDLPVFGLATQAQQGDSLATPAWCGDSSGYLAAIGASGAWIRTNIKTDATTAGCPLLDSNGAVVGITTGVSGDLVPSAGYVTIAAALSSAAAWKINGLPISVDANTVIQRAHALLSQYPQVDDPTFMMLMLNLDGIMPWWCRAADLGDVSSLLPCARGYLNGAGAPYDIERALDLLHRAAAAGVSQAAVLAATTQAQFGSQIALGKAALAAAQSGDVTQYYAAATAYAGGMGVSSDAAQAAYWYAHCVSTDARCAISLGEDYLYGTGVIKDADRGVDLLVSAIQLGPRFQSDQARFFLASYYLSGVPVYQPDNARPYLQQLINENGPFSKQAQAMMARLPAEPAPGHDTVRDRIFAALTTLQNTVVNPYGNAPLFQALAHTGDAEALYVAGLFFHTSAWTHWGESYDNETAAEYFSNASSMGDYRATAQLAAAYGSGDGVKLSLQEQQRLQALEITQALKAASQGDVDAYHYLGWAYMEQDCTTAATWFTRAATAQQSAAESQLDALLVRTNLAGFTWEVAGDDDYELGMLYTRDPRLNEIYPSNPCFDPVAGERWLRHAIARGSANAAYRLGFLLENGTLGRTDIAQAKQLYAFAAARGNVMAAQRLRSLGP